MKKIINLLLTFAMVLSLSACGSSERTNWSAVAMSNVLPTPASTSIKVQTNTDQELYGYIQKISSEQYVGKSSYSKQTCEECGREGTNSIIGISGQIEYYCSTHYKELQELMEIFGQ